MDGRLSEPLITVICVMGFDGVLVLGVASGGLGCLWARRYEGMTCGGAGCLVVGGGRAYPCVLVSVSWAPRPLSFRKGTEEGSPLCQVFESSPRRVGRRLR